jgi:hypothetical protein
LYQTEQEDYVRQAAYRGLVLASGKHALPMLLEAIVGPPGPTQTAALQLVHEFKSAEATKGFIEVLPKVGIPVQIALIGGLSQCDDPAAAPAIAAFAGWAMRPQFPCWPRLPPPEPAQNRLPRVNRWCFCGAVILPVHC